MERRSHKSIQGSKPPQTQSISNTPTAQASSPMHQLYADPAAAAGQAVDKVAAVRVWLLKEKPFFGVLARALAVEPTLQTPAFRLTLDDRLLVNPLIVLEIKFPALCARIAHLALHAALGGLLRCGTRDPLRWNVAHDLAIEPLLRAASLATGLPLPTGIVDLPDGASAEEYYLAVSEGTRPGVVWCDISDPPPPEGTPPVAGQFTRQDDDQGNDPGSGQKRQEGQDHESRDDDDDGDSEQDVPLQSISSVDARARELQWKMRLAAALEEEEASGGKSFGEIPGWIDELVQATIEPPPDWTAELQRSVSMLTRADRSYLRPSRRMSALAGDDGSWPDVVSMPGRRVLPAGKLVNVIDTSASIDPDTLARFLGAVASAATTEGFDEVRLIQADAEVTGDETLFAAELLFQKIAMVGRGGTDFGPALHKLEAESRRMCERFTVIYLTDLDGKFPDPEDIRLLDVLWVVVGKADKVPPFGKAVEIPVSTRNRP